MIKLKISSLKIIFYKSNNSVISKINFPFEFISFFYGLNIKDFLKFLIYVINFDYSKNIFNLDFNAFIKLYNNYKEKKVFFEENSFFRVYSEKNEEYLAFYWDVKNGKNSENYVMKIFLPKIKIGIMDKRKKIFFNFFYSLEVYKMLHLIRDNFRLWDFFVLKFFSDYKMFRLEINRIMSNKSALINKYNNNRFKLFNKYDFINNNIKKKSINFNKINNILKDNTINNLQFFYSRNNNPSSVSALKSETFFFEIEIPKIHINYNYNKDNSVDKYFDLSMKKLLQINKLKKCFELEDLVKFSMSIVDKNEKKLKLVRKFSFFENNKYRRAKKSTTISSSVKEIRSNIKYNSFRIQQFNNERNVLRYLENKLNRKNKNQKRILNSI